MFTNTFLRNSNRCLLKSIFTDEYSCFRFKIFQLEKNFKAKSSNQITTLLPSTKQSSNYYSFIYYCLSAAVGVQLLQIETPNEVEENKKIHMIIQKAFNHIENQEFDKAESYLHEALDLAQEKNNLDGIWLVYNNMAGLALRRNQIERAEKLNLQVKQKLLAKGVLPSDLKIAHINLNLGHIYELLKSNKKAEENYKLSYEVVQQNLETEKIVPLYTSMLWINILNNYGVFLIKQAQQIRGILGDSQLNKGISFLKKAVDAYTLIKKQENEVVDCRISNDNSYLRNVRTDSENTIDFLKTAVENENKLPRLPELSHLYINLGVGYLIKGLYEESTAACQEGLEKAKENNDTQSIIYANACLNNISQYFSNKS